MTTPIPGPAGRDLRVYVSSDDAKTVVARRAPMVAGPAEHSRIGPIISVDPQLVRRPEYPGGQLQTLPAQVLTGTPRSGAAAIAAAGVVGGMVAAVALAIATTLWLGVPVGVVAALVGGWVAWRRQLQVEHAWADHRVLTRHEDRQAFRAAVSAARYTLRAWPELQTAVALDDPGPTLAGTLWELAGALAERARVRDAVLKLEQAARSMTIDGGAPADARVHADVTARLDRAREVQQRLDREAVRRLDALTALAAEADRFIGQRRAAAAARAVVRDTDQVLGALGGAEQEPLDDPGTELAERTAAVLAAYRELTSNSPR